MNLNETSITRNDSERIKLLDTFLSAFFSEAEPIHIRAFKPKGAPDSPSNRPTKLSITRASLKEDRSVFDSLRELNRERGVYFVVNAGQGQTKTEITRPTAFFAESDHLSKEDQHRLLDDAPLKPSIRVETLRSVHSYWIVDGACDVREWEQFQSQLIRYLTGVGLRADATIKDASRVMRLPEFDHLSYNSDMGQYGRVPVKIAEFEPYRRYTLAAMRAAFAKASNEIFDTGPSKELPDKILDGEGRHREMVSLAGTLNNRGMTVTEMFAMLRIVNEQRCVPPLEDEKLHAIVDSVSNYESSNPIGEPPKQEPLTDFGNASRLVRSFGDLLCYDRERRLWLCWDGRKWAVESSDVLPMQLAFKVPDVIIQEAAAAKDESNKKELLKHAIRSQSARALEAIVRLARNRNEIAANVETFDPQHHLLNVANGTIDLRTGTLREHHREDMITKLVGIDYYGIETSAPLFEKFLTRIFDGNQSLISFMQRVCGYTLTGETGEQCMFLLHGDGANGKSTFIETVRAVTGEYAAHVRTEALMKHRNTSAGAASGDIAELRGARFVSAVETNVGQQLAEGLLKQITGDDVIKARQLYSTNIEFRPSFKLWLACNAKPEIGGVDHAIWRRIHLIPFDVTIPEHERNKHILSDLKAELPGILAWCVRGASEWYRQGLNVPDEVKQATQRYKVEEDTLSEFIADNCEIGDDLSSPVSEIYMMFEMWCRANGESVIHRKSFAQTMRARGFKQAQAHRGRIWRGITRRPLTASLTAN